MEINSIRLARMRNDAHFQFHADIIALINGAGAAALKIDAPLLLGRLTGRGCD